MTKASVMRIDPPDCLIGKFSNYRRLTKAEKAFLKDLQKHETVLAAGTDVIEQEETSKNLFVLKSGWAYAYKLLPNGRRQVLEFLLPGDFLGIREFAYESALNFVVTCAPSVVCPFPKKRMDELFTNFPRLASTLMQVSTREQVILMERVINLGSRNAYQRLAHFFMEMYMRLSAVALSDGERYAFPVSQQVLADALGLSKVHINRTLMRLKRDQVIALSDGFVTLLDRQAAMSAAQFDAFYLNDKYLRQYLA